MTKVKKYGIWYQPDNSNWEDGWVLDEKYVDAVYSSESAAKKDLRGFVHPDAYEVRPYARPRRSRA
jgi:hypothetical protein